MAAVASGQAAGWWNVEGVGKAITALVAVAALGSALGHILFWSSSTFGNFHLKASDNPLAEIAAAVGRLRRWSPRRTRAQRMADSALGTWLALWGSLLIFAGVEARDTALPAAGGHWLGQYLVSVVLFIVVAVLVFGARPSPVPPEPPESQEVQEARAEPVPKERTSRRPSMLAWVLGAVLVGALLALLVNGVAGRVSENPGWFVASSLIAMILGLVTFAQWTRRTVNQPRRPLLVVIDDLDRCQAERVVRLMETVHTLLREPSTPSVFPRWRRPANLMVLVLADGRWVRAAFEKVYDDFKGLGTPAHGLGADFIQKVFDHTVVVPALSVDQTRTYMRVVTESPAPPASPATAQGSGPRHVAATNASAKAAAVNLIDDIEPARVYDPATSATVAALPEVDRLEVEALRAGKAAQSAEAGKHAATHLLNDFAELMPANPRLVKRVADAWGMLRALKGHLNHPETDETLARAAIVMVRFPTLVDALLSDIIPPDELVADPTPSPDATAVHQQTWLRPDVQQVVTGVTARQLARCFGREFPPARPVEKADNAETASA